MLARHELGFVSRLTGLRRRRGGDDDETAPAAPPPVGRLVAPIEELGPTFVRLAQLIAKRADLLPPDRRIELAGTSWPDRSLGADAVEEVLLEQFGAAGHPVTLALGAEPVAATATTETYEATLDDGREVLVTVRRPGVAGQLQRDLSLARPAARVLNRRDGIAARMDVVAEVERAADLLDRELDLTLGAQVLERVALAAPAGTELPEVVWPLTTPEVLTVTRVGDASDPATMSALATALVRALRAGAPVVLELPSAFARCGEALVLTGALRTAEVHRDAMARLATLVTAVGTDDSDAIADALTAVASRGTSPARAALRGELARRFTGEASRAGVGARLDAALTAGGRAGLVFDDDLCLVVAALVDLDVMLAEVGAAGVEVLVHRLLASPDRGIVDTPKPLARTGRERGVRPVVGLVLSGGAVRGAAHAGVFAALAEAGVRVDLVAGTSAGAILGALVAAGTATGEIQRIVRAMRWSTVARPYPSRLSLADAGPMEAFLAETLGDLRFDQLVCPLAVVACDLLTGERVVLDEGLVAPAVRASAAIPGFFPPVEIGDRLLVDGGVVDNLPVDVARDWGARYVIAVDVSSQLAGRRPTGAFEVLNTASTIMMRQQERLRPRPDVLIRPDLVDFGGWAPGDVTEIEARGRVAAEAVIDRILADLGR